MFQPPSHFIVPHLGVYGKSAFVPLIYQKNITARDSDMENRWVLSSKEIRSLIVSALIFLVVFSWIDVVASAYRNHYLKLDTPDKILASAPLQAINKINKIPKSPHRVPDELRATTEELTVKRKIGYSVLLSVIAIVFYVLLSLPFPQVKVNPVRSTNKSMSPEVLERSLF